MTTALYRRYRPDTFADVIGQEHVTEPLMQALRSGRVNHAYLFSGPRGCGKTTSARILARTLNCAANTPENPMDTPCGLCASCIELARGGSGSLDVVEIDAASHGGVDDARDLRERATFAPTRDRFKIFIIDEAHMVTSAGFNALLKIVEEPPAHIKFIFATTEPDKVIGTIRSRTHHYPFRLVAPDVLGPYIDHLCTAESVQLGSGVVPLIVRAGGGSVRDSLSVLDQLIAGSTASLVSYDTAVGLLGYTHAALLDDVVDALAARDGAALFRVIDQIVASGHPPQRFVEDVLQRMRDLIVIAVSGQAARAVLRDVPQDQLDRMQAQAGRTGLADLTRAAELSHEALTTMSGATSARLHLELLCARLLLPGAQGGDAGLLARLERLERGGVQGAAAAAGSALGLAPAPGHAAGGVGLGAGGLGAAVSGVAGSGVGADAGAGLGGVGTAPAVAGVGGGLGSGLGGGADASAGSGAGGSGGVSGAQAVRAALRATREAGLPTGGGQEGGPTTPPAGPTSPAGLPEQAQMPAQPSAQAQLPAQTQVSAQAQASAHVPGRTAAQDAPVADVPPVMDIPVMDLPPEAGVPPVDLSSVPADAPVADEQVTPMPSAKATGPGQAADLSHEGRAAELPHEGQAVVHAGGQAAPAPGAAVGSAAAASPGGQAYSAEPAQSEMLRRRWPEVIAAVQGDAPRAWLQENSQVVSLQQSVLTLGFPNESLARVASQPRATAAIQDAVQHTLGLQVSIVAVVSGSQSLDAPHQQPPVDGGHQGLAGPKAQPQQLGQELPGREQQGREQDGHEQHAHGQYAQQQGQATQQQTQGHMPAAGLAHEPTDEDDGFDEEDAAWLAGLPPQVPVPSYGHAPSADSPDAESTVNSEQAAGPEPAAMADPLAAGHMHTLPPPQAQGPGAGTAQEQQQPQPAHPPVHESQVQQQLQEQQQAHVQAPDPQPQPAHPPVRESQPQPQQPTQPPPQAPLTGLAAARAALAAQLQANKQGQSTQQATAATQDAHSAGQAGPIPTPAEDTYDITDSNLEDQQPSSTHGGQASGKNPGARPLTGVPLVVSVLGGTILEEIMD